jgi:hypothetical protein
MVAKKSTLKGIIFFLVLVVLALGYSMYTISRQNAKETYSSDTEQESSISKSADDKNTPSSIPPKMEDAYSDDVATVVTSPDTCEKDLLAKLKSEKTEYEKGRILVGFNKDISFSKAKSVITKYDLTPVTVGVDEDSYNTLKLLTVNVPTGREPYFVCLLKKDSSVRYTNVSAYLFLHD